MTSATNGTPDRPIQSSPADEADTGLHFANLSWRRVQEVLDSPRTPVLLFPLGSTEPHGPHSPLSTDPIISMGMCVRLAGALADDEELRALVLPPLGYGVTRYTQAFAGAIHVEEETLKAVIVDVCRSLIKQGFRHIVLVNNHFEPEHIQTIHAAIDAILKEDEVLIGYLDLTRRVNAMRLTEEFVKAECHAGRYETSLVLADHPELVDAEAMRKLPPLPINLADRIGQGLKDFPSMGLTEAYNGAPAEATAEEGQESFATLTEMLLEVVRSLVAGTGGRDRSGLYGRV